MLTFVVNKISGKMYKTLSSKRARKIATEKSGLNNFTKALIVFAVVSLFSGSIFAQASKATQTNSEHSMQLVIMPLNDALDRNFRPLHEDKPNGPQLHVLEGDPDSGPSLTLFRYGKNYSGSRTLHNHTHNYRLWLIEGKMKHWDADGSEETATVLEPGSYLYQPADEFHAANCLTKRCTAYVLFDGPIETDFPDDKSIKTKDN